MKKIVASRVSNGSAAQFDPKGSEKNIRELIGKCIVPMISPARLTNQAPRPDINQVKQVFSELALAVREHLVTRLPSDKLDSIVRIVLHGLGNNPTESDRTGTDLNNRLLDHCFSLSAYPETLITIDQPDASASRRAIQEAGAQAAIDQLDRVLARHNPESKSNYLNKDGTETVWRPKVLALYNAISSEALKLIDTMVADGKRDGVHNRLNSLDDELSGITSCETALVSDYSRLLIALRLEASDSEFSARDHVLINLRNSLIEPGILSLTIELFEKSGIQFLDAYGNTMTPRAAALDHHTQYCVNEMARQLFVAGPAQKDRYPPPEGVLEVLSHPEFQSQFGDGVRSLLSYSQVRAVITEDPALLGRTWGEMVAPTWRFEGLLHDIGSSGASDLDEFSETHFTDLLPYVAHHILEQTECIHQRKLDANQGEFVKNMMVALLSEDNMTVTSWVSECLKRPVPDTQVKPQVLNFMKQQELDPLEVAIEADSKWLIDSVVQTMSPEEIEKQFNSYDEKGLTLIHHCCATGKISVLDTLRRHDKTRNHMAKWLSHSTDSERYTPMMLAADQKQEQIIQFMGEHFPDVVKFQVFQKSKDERSFFHIAALNGADKCLDLAIPYAKVSPFRPKDSGYTPMRDVDQFGKNVLHYAVDGKDIATVKSVLDWQFPGDLVTARIPQADGHGYTPAAMAIVSGQPEILAEMRQRVDIDPLMAFGHDDYISLAIATGDHRCLGALFNINYEDHFETAKDLIVRSNAVTDPQKSLGIVYLVRASRELMTDPLIQDSIEFILKQPAYFDRSRQVVDLLDSVKDVVGLNIVNDCLGDSTFIYSDSGTAGLLKRFGDRLEPRLVAQKIHNMIGNAPSRGTNLPALFRDIFAGISRERVNDIVVEYFNLKSQSSPHDLIESVADRLNPETITCISQKLNFQVMRNEHILSSFYTLLSVNQEAVDSSMIREIQTQFDGEDLTRFYKDFPSRVDSDLVVCNIVILASGLMDTAPLERLSQSRPDIVCAFAKKLNSNLIPREMCRLMMLIDKHGSQDLQKEVAQMISEENLSQFIGRVLVEEYDGVDKAVVLKHYSKDQLDNGVLAAIKSSMTPGDPESSVIQQCSALNSYLSPALVTRIIDQIKKSNILADQKTNLSDYLDRWFLGGYE